jgi:CheY-like chemotaxis protein
MLVLYADDDIDDYYFFDEILKKVKPGATCVNARDGAEALKILGGLVFLPNIVFLDINMPAMDGKTCLKYIKNDSRFAGIPIVVYTTSVDEKDRQQCLQLGAEQYLIKPYAISDAEILITSALEIAMRK